MVIIIIIMVIVIANNGISITIGVFHPQKTVLGTLGTFKMGFCKHWSMVVSHVLKQQYTYCMTHTATR